MSRLHTDSSLSALLYCNEKVLRNVLHEAMRKFSIDSHICSEPAEARSAIESEVLDSVMIDWAGGRDSKYLLEMLRSSDINSAAFGVAVVRNATEIKACFASGANYAIHCPETMAQAVASLKPIHARLIRERRLDTRCMLRIPAILSSSATRSDCTVRDLCSTGMCIDTNAMLARQTAVSVHFKLPGRESPVEVSGTVAWSTRGQCGFHFHSLGKSERRAIAEWLAGEKTPCRRT